MCMGIVEYYYYYYYLLCQDWSFGFLWRTRPFWRSRWLPEGCRWCCLRLPMGWQRCWLRRWCVGPSEWSREPSAFQLFLERPSTVRQYRPILEGSSIATRCAQKWRPSPSCVHVVWRRCSRPSALCWLPSVRRTYKPMMYPTDITACNESSAALELLFL